jgi:hypothetical protein
VEEWADPHPPTSLVVLVVLVVEVHIIRQPEQEIPHQHHHHKEILVATVQQAPQIMGQEEEVELLNQELQELLLPVEQVEMEQHLLFLEHQ